MSTQSRRYGVSGIDDLGDVHVYRTDHRKRADEIQAIMSKDLDNVDLIDTEADG